LENTNKTADATIFVMNYCIIQNNRLSKKYNSPAVMMESAKKMAYFG
jgi:hypothetical protein